ncbi:glycosyltransferase [Butyrivibrio sp. FC2001]|uniref:glycosyltransferase n=1 Tax=Butyrivibrio sp. FC2001 TaxID=1280671 RepID=UPI000400554D|nr:glycosyltransferase [Butyrivibrio sp. FC2001]
MNFTFLSFTYNHASFIAMHLESIKYQVENFFSNDKVTIIVSDDGSKDNTLEIVNRWKEQNESLFSNFIVLGDGINRGTCSNFLRALEYLNDEYFYVLAGDDVYGFRDLKNALRQLNKYDFVSGICPAFSVSDNGEYFIDDDYKDYKTAISKGTAAPIFHRLLSIEGCIAEAAPAIYKKAMINDDVKKRIANLKLIEDQPMVYEFFRKKKIRMNYMDKSYVMYRVNPLSVSHTQNSTIREIARDDLTKLLNYYDRNEKKILYKYAISIRRMVIDGKRSFVRLMPSYLYIMLRQNIFNRKLKEIFRHGIIEDKETCEKHLNELNQKSQAFLEGTII